MRAPVPTRVDRRPALTSQLPPRVQRAGSLARAIRLQDIIGTRTAKIGDGTQRCLELMTMVDASAVGGRSRASYLRECRELESAIKLQEHEAG